MTEKKTAPRRPAPRAAAPARPARASRYAGIKASVAHPPRLMPGKYLLLIEKHAEGKNDKAGSISHKAYFQVAECLDDAARKAHSPGDIAYESWRVTGAGSIRSLGDLKAYMMAACGYDSRQEADFDAFTPEGEVYEATLGEQNSHALDGGDPVAGRYVIAHVLRGNDVADKDDFYRDYIWAPVEECGVLVLGEDGIETLALAAESGGEAE